MGIQKRLSGEGSNTAQKQPQRPIAAANMLKFFKYEWRTM